MFPWLMYSFVFALSQSERKMSIYELSIESFIRSVNECAFSSLQSQRLHIILVLEVAVTTVQ